MRTNIRYKGHNISRTQVYNNLKKVLELSIETDHNSWYKDAHSLAFNFSKHLKYGLCENLSKSCGIIAALSPIKTWEENKEIAEKFILTGYASHTARMTNKAINILESNGSDEAILKILNGPKISSFYHNIRHWDTSNRVTIDRHALSCCFLRKSTDAFYHGMTKNQYAWFEMAYQYAAEKLNIQPSMLQSITWCTWRRVKNDHKKINKVGAKVTEDNQDIANQLDATTELLNNCPF